MAFNIVPTVRSKMGGTYSSQTHPNTAGAAATRRIKVATTCARMLPGKTRVAVPPRNPRPKVTALSGLIEASGRIIRDIARVMLTETARVPPSRSNHSATVQTLFIANSVYRWSARSIYLQSVRRVFKPAVFDIACRNGFTSPTPAGKRHSGRRPPRLRPLRRRP